MAGEGPVRIPVSLDLSRAKKDERELEGDFSALQKRLVAVGVQTAQQAFQTLKNQLAQYQSLILERLTPDAVRGPLDVFSAERTARQRVVTDLGGAGAQVNPEYAQQLMRIYFEEEKRKLANQRALESATSGIGASPGEMAALTAALATLTLAVKGAQVAGGGVLIQGGGQ